MARNDKNLQGIYNTLKQEGYNPPAYEEFVNDMQDDNNLQGVHATLKKCGYTPPEFNEFKTDMFGSDGFTTSQALPQAQAVDIAPVAEKDETQATQQASWQPTEQDKLQTSYELHTMLNDFNRRSRERVEQAQRLTEPLTAEGRKKRRVIQGQVIGSPKKLPGITPPAVAPSSNVVEGDAQQPTIQSGQSPVPYGVKYVNGKPITQWLLPDGRLTTDITEADQAEYGARAVRLRKQFEERMKQNGLDPAKAEDVQRQTILERLDNNRRMQLEKDRELGEDAAKEWEWDAEAGFFDNIGRLARNSIMRSEGAKFGSELREEADADMHNMKAENYMLSKALKRLDAGRLKKSDGILGGMFDVGNNLKNFGAGVADAASDENLYIGGMADYNVAKQLMDINRKVQDGRELTESDMNLVYASLLNMKAEQQTSVPYMYSAGATIVEMTPFMLEMISNPASGLSKAMTRKFGKTAIKRFGTTVAGDIAEAAVLSNTIQAPKTISDAMQRFVGDPIMNEEGKVVGFDGNNNALESFAKAQGSSIIENYTELLGNHFGAIGDYIGKGITAGAKKIGLGNVVEKTSELISRISSTDWAKGIRNIEQRAQWNGTLGEIAEEEAGIVLNSLFVGDNSLSDLVDKDQQINIALGIGLFGGFVSGIKTGGYLAGKHRAERQLQKADKHAANSLGDKWQGIRNAIDDAEDNILTETVMQQIAVNAETADQADAVVRYAHTLMRSRGYNRAGAERAAEAMDNPEMAETIAQQSKAENSYDKGRALYERYEQGDETAQAEADATALRMNEAYDVLNEAFGDNSEYYIACFEATDLTEEQRASAPWELLDNPELTFEQKDAVLYYINAKAALDGVMDASNESAENKRAEVKRSVDKRTNKDNGMIIPAETKMGKQVYIVKGNVVMSPDGKEINRNNSNSQFWVFNPESGKFESSAPELIERLGEAVNPEEELRAAHTIIEQEQMNIFGKNATAPAVEADEVNAVVPENAETAPNSIENAEIDAENREKSTETVPGTSETATEPQQSVLSRIPMSDAGEPMFESVDSATGWDGLVEATGSEADAAEIAMAQVQQATSDLEALNKKPPTIKAPKLKGSPMVMAQAKREAADKYRSELARYNEQIADARARIDAWNGILGVYNSRNAELRLQQEEERRQQEAIAHDEAVTRFEEEQRIKAEKQAEQERIGTHAVNPKIKDKWEAAPKVDGNSDAITLPDGSTLTGRYILTEAGAASASHDANNAYMPTEGFPVDENGQSVNDRDYMRDKDAQRIVEGMAGSYDNRALQDPVIVSTDGVVLSGNNRTMSGDLAAQRGTDGAYVDYLAQFGHKKYGFTPEQVTGMKNPRVVFVPDEVLPYNATTFARFNAQEKKSQGKPEAAVKLGKIVPDNVFAGIVGDISRYDRLSDYYADEKAVAQALGALMQAGVINDKQLPELRTGTALSATGRELIENTLIGKVFQASPDAVRQVISVPTLRQSVVMGLGEIANNRTLTNNDYDISEELAKAIDLVARAKASLPDIYVSGMPVSPFGRQQGLFDDEFGDSSVSDATTLLLADILNSGKPSDLRKLLSTYNNEASQASGGQMDMFSGAVATKEEILTNVNELFKNATPREQQALVDAAIAERKFRAENAAEQPGGNETAEQTPAPLQGGAASEIRAGGNAGRDSQRTDNLPEKEITAPLSEETDEHGKPFVKARNGSTDFGTIDAESGLAEAPIKLSLGENYKDENGKNHGYGLIHIEAGHGAQIRNAGFSSVEEFVESVARNYETIREGNRYGDKPTYLLKVSDGHNNTLFIQLSNDGMYWNVNSAGIFREKYSRRRPKAKPVPTIGSSSSTETTEVNHGQNEGATVASGNSSMTSDSKVTNSATDKQEKGVESSEPTEAQKAAGNYKMEHRRVDGHNISIENTKGSVRRGKGADGKEWETTMQNDYGYIRGTEGVDGDHIDVFLSDTPEDGDVFVVDQVNEDGSFDEHKVMYGFPTEQAAREAYLSNYEAGWTGLGAITHVSKEEFKKWIGSSRRKTKPFADYAKIKKNGILHPKSQVGKSVSLNDSSNPTNSDNGTARLGINSSANDEKLSPGSEWSLTEAPSESEGPDLVPTSDNVVNGNEREDGQLLILPSESSEEAGALSSPTLDSPTDRKVNTLSVDKQAGVKVSLQDNAFEPTDAENNRPSTDNNTTENKSARIEDFGEKIAGARKDMLRDVAKSIENVTVQSLIELPMSKAFKRPMLKKMVDNGVVSNEDAILAEAIMQALVYGKKKPSLTRRLSSKRDIKAWAEETYRGIKLLGEVLSGDETRKSAALAQRQQELSEQLRATNEHIAKLREWNPGKEFTDRDSALDSVDVIRQVLDGIGYQPGDKVDLPLTRIELTAGNYYMVSAPGKQGAFWFKNHHATIDEAIGTMILAAKLARGDMDAELPGRQFRVRGAGTAHTEPTGKYIVGYLGKSKFDYREAILDSEEKAAAYAKEKGGTVRAEMRSTGEYDSYNIVAINPLTGNTHIVKDGFESRSAASEWLDSHSEEGNSSALEAMYKELGTKGEARPHFFIGSSYNKGTGGMIYSVVSDDKSNPWPIVKDFDSRAAAEKWYAENIERLESERKSKKAAERAIVYYDNAGARQGEDYRRGEDATPEMFGNAFGFRGVQFGNWTNDADRQAALNQAYDALMDLSKVLGLTPRALSLEGELGLAFGARGNGTAAAHYEPTEVVINLTKTQGAGALAHEWWHAIDNFLSRRAGVPTGYASSRNGIENMNPAVRSATNELMKAINQSPYAKRSLARGEYWGRPTEIMARFFESWAAWKLGKDGMYSPFLSGGLSPAAQKFYQDINYLLYKENEMLHAQREGRKPKIMTYDDFVKTPESLNGYPYPTKPELAELAPRLEDLFTALAERENRSGSIAMERGRKYGKQITGMTLFDWADTEERHRRTTAVPDETALSAETANTAIEEYADSYKYFIDQSTRLEQELANIGADEAEAEAIREQMASAEEVLTDARERLSEALRDYYVRENTPEDAKRIVRDLIARVQGEVDVRINKEQFLKDMLEQPATPETHEPEKSDNQIVKTAAGNISYNAIGHLPDCKAGEFAYIERQFSRSGEFAFTGNEHIIDRGDIAYMFRALEDYSVEHVFAVFVKDGRAKVLHIGMGGPTASFANMGAIRAGYDAFGADKIYLVHNHPSGTLMASVPDLRLLKNLESAFAGQVETEGIIIDTTSGRYTAFNSDGVITKKDRPQQGGRTEVEVVRFDRMKRHGVEEAPTVIRNSDDISRFITDHRLGMKPKVSYIVLANNNEIVGNFHTDYNTLDAEGLADELASVVTRFGGTKVVVYGNVDIKPAFKLGKEVKKRSLEGVMLLDAIEITNGLSSSAHDRGLIAEANVPYRTEMQEPSAENGNKYRLIAERELLDFLDGQPLKKGYRYSQWANMGVLPPMTAKQNGEWRAPMIFGRWEQSEEGMRKENGKADLVQGNGRTTGDVAYNPYFHIRTSPLNDQFTAAYDRPELLVVEGYYPESEETSGYQAEGAKDSVGLMDWHSGSVNGQLSDDTKVQTMLSRYFKPGRIVPWSEVADLIMERVGNQKITFPINAVPPMLRAELAKRGAKFGDISGSVSETDIPMLNELRDRVNAGEWDAGLEKARAYLDAYESSTEAKEARVADLSQRANTPVRIVRTQEEADALPTSRERRAKGWWSAKDDEVVIVLPNNVNVADVDNTFVHEVAGHKGLRALVDEERFDEFLGEIYDHASNPIRKVIDKMTDKMVSEEADRLRVRKAQAHERAGEDVNANYYTDMAEARVEAEKKREEFRKEATEEYMSDLGGRIGSEGFEKMSRDELTLWGKIKAKVQKFLDMFLRGLKIAKSIRLTDKDLSYILYKSWKNLRKKGVFADAEDAVMRMRTGWDEAMLSKSAKIDDVNSRFNKELQRQVDGNLPDGHIYQLGLPSAILRSTGVPNLPIQMSATRLRAKATEYGHDFDLTEIKNLVKELQTPIAVFAYGNKGKMQNIIIGIDSNGKQFIVGLSLNPIINGKALEINSVRNVFPKNNAEWLNWISQGKLLYADKQRIQALIDKQRTILADVDYLDLEDVAKVIKTFENPTIEENESFRFRDGADYVERTPVMARAMYEKQIQTNLYQFTEAMQDSMRGLMEFYIAVESQSGKRDIEDVSSFENAYTAENALSSRNYAEATEYERRVLRPLLDIVARMSVNEKGREKLLDYMMAKHGLERNAYMRNEAAANGEKTDRDFAGLCGLTGEENWQDAETAAQQIVADYEVAHSADISNLWKAVNIATKTSLKKVYDCGLLSKEQYENIRDMYKYYIPLGGFDEKTSDDVYGYLTSKAGGFSSPIKKAEGRRSKADDPLATIAHMAQNSIIQGNRNLMKQKFLTYVQNHPSDLASVNRLWLVYDEITDIWKPVFADIDETMTPDEIGKAVMDFEERMESLSQSNPKKYKRGRDAIDIPYRLIDDNIKEHQILVKRNGESFVITINGNPRAAQAINGLTNPDNDLNGAIGKVFKMADTVNRQISQIYTTRNPDFVVSNFIRDLIYSTAVVHVKESQGYAMRFHLNHLKAMPLRMTRLLRLYDNNKLDMKNPTHRMFYEFMHWGGETGYTMQRNLEREKKLVKEIIKDARRGTLNPKKILHLLGNLLDSFTRGVENSARFAAYVTSRQSGRDVQRSVYDAKEITINFNKKGSGSKFLDAKGQTVVGKTAAFTSGAGRSLFIFWNAAVQGVANYAKAFKKHPRRAIITTTALTVLGYVMSALMDDGDDEDKNGYYNIPRYIRRSNIMFRAGEQWISIPLPVEFRALYGLGELAYGVISGREEYSEMELAKEICAQLSQLMPLDVMEGGGGVNAFVPSFIKPVVESTANTSWTGLPIYKDTPFNKDMPEWTKAYPRTNVKIVNLAKWANEASGGNDYNPGWVNINPAQLEYLLNGYFGGYFNLVNKLDKTGETILGKREYDPSSIILLNRVVKMGDERTADKKKNSDFFNYLEEYKRTHTLLRKYEEEAERGSEKYSIFLDALKHSRNGARHDLMDDYISNYNWLYKAINDPDFTDEERAIYENDMRRLKHEVVTLMKVAHDSVEVNRLREQFDN